MGIQNGISTVQGFREVQLATIRRSDSSVGHTDGQRGAVFFETMLVAPIFLLIIFTIIQFIHYSHTYLSMTQIVREALLAATTFRNAAPGAVTDPSISETAIATCLSNPAPGSSPTAQCAHQVAHWRVQRLLESNGLNPNEYTFESTYTSGGANQGFEVKLTNSSSLKLPFTSTSLLRVRSTSQYVGN